LGKIPGVRRGFCFSREFIRPGSAKIPPRNCLRLSRCGNHFSVAQTRGVDQSEERSIFPAIIHDKMKKLLFCILFSLCTLPAHAQSEPIVIVNNLAIAHEHRGWRVLKVSTTPIHFNLQKDDLIIRIDGKNAADSGPMIMTSLLNEGYRHKINLFIERNSFRLDITLRDILTRDYNPIGSNPFKHVASGFSAPDEEFEDIDNQSLTLEQFRGKWMLIDFMATWCPPCLTTLPKIQSVATEDHLSMLTVALNDKDEAVRRVQHTYHLQSPVTMVKAFSQLPIDFGITTNLWSGEIPSFVLIRPDGEVALIAVGAPDIDSVKFAIHAFVTGSPINLGK
jgi:thiol-disulfide isomerase/thioredoxin